MLRSASAFSARRGALHGERMTRHSLVGGASRAFLARGLGAALAFGVGVAVTRALGPAGAGIYFLAVTLATIASVLGRLGLDQLLVRRIAAARAAQSHGRLRGVGRAGPMLAATVSTAVSVALFALAPLLEERLFHMQGLATTVRAIAVGVLPLSLVTVYGECLRGFGRTGTSQLVQIALPPAATLALLAIALPLLGRTPSAAAWAFVGGSALAALVAAATWRRAVAPLSLAKPEGSARELARAAFPFLGVSLLSLALAWISMLALALRGDAAEVGLFAVAYRTATVTSLILVAVNAAAAPRFAEMAAHSDRAALGRGARQAALLTSAFALPLLVAFWVAPGGILSLFGPGFEQGATVLAILATGQFVNVLTGSVGELLMMSGHERVLRAALCAAVALSLALHALLVPAIGVVGAALANAITLAALNVSALVLVRRRLSIDVLPFMPRARTEHGGG